MKIFFLLLVISSSALANDAGLLKCRRIADATARLACYDALTLAVSGSRSGPDALQQTAEQFGMEQQVSKVALDAIESQILGHLEGWNPKTTLRLANGQIWQISDDSKRMQDFHNPKVKIRRGALGAFYLEIEGTNVSPRVKRLQ